MTLIQKLEKIKKQLFELQSEITNVMDMVNHLYAAIDEKAKAIEVISEVINLASQDNFLATPTTNIIKEFDNFWKKQKPK